MKYLFASILFLSLSSSGYGQWAGFSIKQEIAVNQRIYNLAVAKSNDDAFPDVIALPTENYSSGQIFRGSESAQLLPAQEFFKGEQYRLLYVADLDKDGIEDLIISGYWLNGFRIYWGSANGQYTPGEHYGLTGHGRTIAVDDMNNDGALDISALSGGSGQPITLHTFLGSNSRHFVPNGIFASVVHTDTRISVVDKNQDGLKDLMIATSFPWYVIFYQHPDGTYTSQYGPYDLDLTKPFSADYYMADFNNDSREDLMAYYFDEGYRIYEGQQDTAFSTTYRSVPTHSRLGRTFVSDLNSDGNMDILMESYTSGYETTSLFYYLLGNGDFTFSEPIPFDVGAPIERLIVADLNADDFPDVILYTENQKLITVLNEGLVSGTDDERINISAYPNPFKNVLAIELDTYPMNVSILDLQGRIQNEFIAKDKMSIDTEHWKNGLYLVRATNGRKRTQFKVVKN